MEPRSASLLPTPPSPLRKILVAGSSHARGMNEVLGLVLGRGWVVEEMSLSGRGVREVGQALFCRKDLSSFFCVILFVGGNDLFSKEGEYKSGQRVGEKLGELRDKLLSSGVDRVVTNPIMLRSFIHNPRSDSIWHSLSKGKHLVNLYNRSAVLQNKLLNTFINPLNLSTKIPKDCYYSPDGLHLNEAGKLEIARAWVKYIENWGNIL